MRYFPEDESGQKDLGELKAQPWQIDLLKLNPSYCSWGNFEDYMTNKDADWATSHTVDKWINFQYGLDDYNEVVNFYFELYRKNHECPHCDGSGKAPAYKKLSDDWYTHLRTDGKQGWSKELTEIEIEALVKAGRLSDLMPHWCRFDEEKNQWFKLETINDKREWVICEAPVMPSPEKVNTWSGKGMGHDSINHWIATDARAKHLGIYGHCKHCKDGIIYDEDFARVALQLWILHPRKGCSKGVYVENIEETELPEVFTYLKEAAERNTERFNKIP